MKNIFYILLLLPTIIFAQYQGNGNQKITLGEQTTADGLVYRGVDADTTLTVKSDTAAYFVLDTVNLNLYTYKASASGRKWRQLGADTAAIAYVNTYGTQTVNGAKTFTSEVTATRFNPTANTATGTGMFLPAVNTLGFSTDGTEKVQITSAGNLGLGVTPSAWGSGTRALQVGTYGALAWSGGVDIGMTNNAYYDGTNWVYIASQEAARFLNNRNTFAWYIAPEGTAGNAITFTQAMTLDASGRLGIGTASPTARLHVKGVDVTDSNFALKVEDSNNLNLLSVKNNGDVTLKNPLSMENGGTGSATQNFVDLTTAQTVGGAKTFTSKVKTDIYYELGNTSEAYANVPGTLSYNDLRGVILKGKTASLFDFSFYTSSGANLLVNPTGTTSMRFTGNVGIGVTSPYSLPLDVIGNARFSAVGAGTFANDLNITSDGTLTTAISDEKYKYNILPISYGLNSILQLKPVNFQWIEGEENDLGFIAQDVAEIIPEAVNTNWNSDLLMRYNSIIPILTKAIQEQQTLIKALEQRIINLENK